MKIKEIKNNNNEILNSNQMKSDSNLNRQSSIIKYPYLIPATMAAYQN